MGSKRKGKKSKSAARKAKNGHQAHPHDGGEKQLERTQQYLGLRRASKDEIFAQSSFKSPSLLPTTDVSGLVSEIESLLDTLGKPDFHPIDVNRPAQFPLHCSVVFIAIDVEAYERNHSQITEIGVATLDTLDLLHLSPGKDGKDWMSKIRGRHLRIEENAYLQNTEFVRGDPNRFEFGTSEWISFFQARSVLAACFEGGVSTKKPTGASASANPGQVSPTKDTIPVDTKRNVVLVGHSIDVDIAFMNNLCLDVYSLTNLRDVLDVAEMDRHMKNLPQSRSLASIIYDFGITGWNLHNAGNDAVYTMQAMLGLALRHGSRSDKSDHMDAKASEKGVEVEDEVYGAWGGEGGDKDEGGSNGSGMWGGDWEVEQKGDVVNESEEEEYYGAWGGAQENEGEDKGGEAEHLDGEDGEKIPDADALKKLGAKGKGRAKLPEGDDQVEDNEVSSVSSGSGGGVRLSWADHSHRYKEEADMGPNSKGDDKEEDADDSD